MKKKIYMLAMAAIAMLTVSCEDDYKTYDTTQTDSVFFDYTDKSTSKSASEISYNFGYDFAQDHEIKIPVCLMGMPKDEARLIELKVVTDKTDMVENVNYTIERAEIGANDVKDTVVIKLLRGQDEEILTKTKQLTIEIVNNGELRPTGQATFTMKYSDIRPTERPDWWVVSGYPTMPEYSFENAQLFFKYFYELVPKANKDVYYEMINRYGDYFVDAKSHLGPLAMYDAFLTKYVLIPLYNDTKGQINWTGGEPKVN